MYNIQVALASNPTQLYNSFVYETIPRNGNGNINDPNDPNSICTTDKSSPCDPDDQITIEADVGVDMAWTQFLTRQDTIVRVTRRDGGSVDPSNVTIRPTLVGYDKKRSGNALLITMPYSANGHRVSIEFTDNLMEYRKADKSADSHYVQNSNPNAPNYVSKYTDNNILVGVEPRNALLLFISPFPSSDKVPDLTKAYKVPQGLVTGLDKVQNSVVYFPPGVYWLTGTAQAILSSQTTWVYLAPGAYVKVC